MRLAADGVTPISRSVLVENLETDNGYVFEPAGPLFLAAGDRITLDGDRLVVERAGGARLSVSGHWSTRCGPASRRRIRGE